MTDVPCCEDTDVQCILDGGALVQCIPWQINKTFEHIFYTYINFLNKRYRGAIVVFDGYPDEPTTKDITHMRRKSGKTGATIIFNENTPLTTQKNNLLE